MIMMLRVMTEIDLMIIFTVMMIIKMIVRIMMGMHVSLSPCVCLPSLHSSLFMSIYLFLFLSPSIMRIKCMQIKDAYNLKFYEDNASRVPSWCEAGGSNEVGIFCQILGKYQMELPGYNTVLPYPHMNENCPTLPPDYSRPLNC